MGAVKELLHYRIYSQDGSISFQRPILVFVHGFGGSMAIWLRQVHKLKSKYDLVLIDMPSHGKSKLMLSEMENSFESVSSQVLRVLDHLKITKATFIGCSLGTMIVKYIVLKKPERVDKYILIGAVGDYARWFQASLKFCIKALPILPMKPTANLVAKILIPRKKSEFSKKLFLTCSRHIPKKEFIAWLKLMNDFPQMNEEFQEAMKNDHKGLYIIGDEDAMFLSQLKTELNRAHNWVIVDECGHVCNLDQPEVVNDLLCAFQDAGMVFSHSV